MEYLLKYFPDLSAHQQEQFAAYMQSLRWWNNRVNLVSRQDIEHLELRHILHSLAIARWARFPAGTTILDIGTGGGLPGIPLAIFFPQATVTMIDGTGKKIAAVQSMITDLGLKNAEALHVRAEDHRGQYDVVVSRAVAPLKDVWKWTRGKIGEVGKIGQVGEVGEIGEVGPPRPTAGAIYGGRRSLSFGGWRGLVVLKGGDLAKEIRQLGPDRGVKQVPIYDLFPEAFFEDKYLVYVPAQ